MAITNRTMTLEELEQLPEPQGFRYELHHGEIIKVPPAQLHHHRIQQRIRKIIERLAAAGDEVSTELGFAIGDRTYLIADVAFVPAARWQAARGKYLEGAPDLVVEIISPSNTRKELRDKGAICLANGSREFWIVDPEQREVEVSTPDGRSLTYKSGQQIALFFASESALPVDAIFET